MAGSNNAERLGERMRWFTRYQFDETMAPIAINARHVVTVEAEPKGGSYITLLGGEGRIPLIQSVDEVVMWLTGEYP